MKELKDLTLDDISIPPKETPQDTPPVAPAQPQPPVEQLKTEADTKAEVSEAFDWADNTGGEYQDFASLWADFKKMKDAPAPEPKEPNFKDNFIKDVVEYYEKTGDLTPYLEAKLVDYDKMSDEDILRRQLRKENSTLSEKAFQRLFDNEMKKYNLDPEEFDSEDVELKREIMQAKAQKLRETWKSEQEQFKAPETKPSEDEQAIIDKYNREVSSNAFVKQATKNGKFDISVGEESYTYEVENPDELANSLYDDKAIFRNMWSEEGDFNFQNYLMTVEFAKDPQKFIERMVAFGKSSGADKVLDDLENPTEIKTPDRTPANSTGGDWKDRFFQAAQQSKRWVK